MHALRSLTLALVTALAAVPALAQDPRDAPDPFLWLEEVESPRALEWVEARNRETLAGLETHRLFEPLRNDILEILTDDDRIDYPTLRGGRVYNFWTDRDHPRGYYRRTTPESYVGGAPDWETVLDIDALAAEEGVPWAYGGLSCLPPAHRRCMLGLSRGGADAVELRELDLERAAFVDGFGLPEAKTSTAWIDDNTLLVATDFGPGSLTTSGYPRQLRRWRRGTPLESAELVYEIDPEHTSLFVSSRESGGRVLTLVRHARTFYDITVHLLDGDRLVRLDVPVDADVQFVGDQLAVFVRTPWEVGGRRYGTGTVIATSLASFLAGGRDFTVVVEPGPRAAVNGVSATRSHLLVSMLDNVRSQIWKYRLVDGEWRGERIDVPELGTANVASTDPASDAFFFQFSSLTQPNTLYLHREDGTVAVVRRLPSQFAGAGVAVEQLHATSKDGTPVPYFVMRPATTTAGPRPTLVYAYGGFELAQTPRYDATVGKAWVEQGGVYVIANIRGGGEFGPAWHRAGLLENRQRVYDDFIAVAEDLIARGITTPARLGIRGGSNGGLLTGVAMTQRPDLFGAVVSAAPLLDMRRYNRLLAGASWMAEYGNPDRPEQWAYIREYSPYQNVRPDVAYPRPLFTTTTRDDRVHPGHARKMAAKMLDQGHDVLYFENTEGGHGSGVTPEQRALMIALTYTYLWSQLGERPVS